VGPDDETGGAPEKSGKTIVIADDEPTIVHLVRFRLERDGHTVIAVSDGEAAREAIREHRPDVCVLDVMMPKLGGLELLQTLRADPETANMRVILLTSRGQETDLDRGFDAGANDYMIKPFSPHELRQRVRAQLAR